MLSMPLEYPRLSSSIMITSILIVIQMVCVEVLWENYGVAIKIKNKMYFGTNTLQLNRMHCCILSSAHLGCFTSSGVLQHFSLYSLFALAGHAFLSREKVLAGFRIRDLVLKYCMIVFTHCIVSLHPGSFVGTHL